MSKLDKIFEILYQDHSYFLSRPEEENKRVEQFKIPRKRTNSYDGNLAALKIKNFLCSIRDRRIYLRIKCKLFKFEHQNPISLLKRLDYTCYTLFEKDNYVLVFRLAGQSFPPCIVYRIFSRLYAISSYKFPVTMPKMMKSRENAKSSISTSNQNIYNEWKVCYVHKEGKRVLKESKLRKKIESITWVSEKYGW